MKFTINLLKSIFNDLKWVFLSIIGIVICLFIVHTNAKSIEKLNNNDTIAVGILDHQMAIIQYGSFNCPGDQHRSIGNDEQDNMFIGCATITDKSIIITWEDGRVITYLSPNDSDNAEKNTPNENPHQNLHPHHPINNT